MRTSELEAQCHDEESRLALDTLLARAEQEGWNNEQLAEAFDANDILLAWSCRVATLAMQAKNNRMLPALAANDDYAPLTAQANELTGGDSDIFDLAALHGEYSYGQVGRSAA